MNHKNNNSISRQILVVEDAPPNQMLLMLLLHKMGHHVTIANNGKEAVEKATQNHYDLIFMDMQMPIMDGIEATRELRRRKIDTPIIALTASVSRCDIDNTFDAGCNAYMAKPIVRGSLKEIINKYLPTDPGQYAEKVNTLKQQTDFLSELCRTEDKPLPPRDGVKPVELIDFDDAMKYCGDEVTIKRVAQSIIVDGSENVKMIESAIKDENARDLLLAAHRLRGVCLLIGAKQIALSSEELENLASTGSIGKPTELLENLKHQFDSLVALLSKPDWLEQVRSTVNT